MSEPISILFQLLMAIVAGPIWPMMNLIYFDVYFMCLPFLQYDAGEKVGEDDQDSIGRKMTDIGRCLMSIDFRLVLWGGFCSSRFYVASSTMLSLPYEEMAT